MRIVYELLYCSLSSGQCANAWIWRRVCHTEVLGQLEALAGWRSPLIPPARWSVTAVVLDRGEQLPDAAAEVAAELKVAGGAGGGSDVARPLVVAPSTGSGREGDLQDRRGRQAAGNRYDMLGTLHCQALVWRHPGSLMHADVR